MELQNVHFLQGENKFVFHTKYNTFFILKSVIDINIYIYICKTFHLYIIHNIYIYIYKAASKIVHLSIIC